MTRRTEAPYRARADVRERTRCHCGDMTHEADGVCSEWCRMVVTGNYIIGARDSAGIPVDLASFTGTHTEAVRRAEATAKFYTDETGEIHHPQVTRKDAV